MASSSSQITVPAFLDAGAFAGALAAGGIAVLWAFLHFGGAASADEPTQNQDWMEKQPAVGEVVSTTHADPVATPQQDSQPKPTTTGARAPVSNYDWQKEDRWHRGMKACREGKEIADEADDWQQRKGGDPMRYRAQMDAAREKLEEGLGQLHSLMESYSNDSSAQRLIGNMITRYTKELKRTGK